MESTVLSEGRNRSKARVRLVRWQGETVVEKDYSGRGLLVRRLLGPRLLDREQAALERLAGTSGVPGLRARPNRQRLLMERLPGRTLSASRPEEVPADFFFRLRRLVRALHRAGVTQGDIGAGDVLVRPDGTPGLVDFSVSICKDAGPLAARAFPRSVRQDLRRVAKLHRRWQPGSLDDEERRLLAGEDAAHRWGRRLRALVRAGRRA